MDRIFMILKKMTPWVILTLPWGYIQTCISNGHYSQTNLLVYISQISGERLQDLHFSIPNRFVSSNIYDIKSAVTLILIYTVVNFLFLDGDAPLRASYGVYISQLIRFARVCYHVTEFNARNKC